MECACAKSGHSHSCIPFPLFMVFSGISGLIEIRRVIAPFIPIQWNLDYPNTSGLNEIFDVRITEFVRISKKGALYRIYAAVRFVWFYNKRQRSETDLSINFIIFSLSSIDKTTLFRFLTDAMFNNEAVAYATVRAHA